MEKETLSDQLNTHIENRDIHNTACQIDREATEAERQDVIAFIEARTVFLNRRSETGDTFRVDECFGLLRDLRAGNHVRPTPVVPVGATDLGGMFEHTPDEGEPHPATECESRGCVKL